MRATRIGFEDRRSNGDRYRAPTRRSPLRVAICAALGSVGAAHGQSADQSAAGPVEEVVITGSRIVRRDFNAPSPVLTVDVEVFEQISNIGVEAVLNQYPQFNPGATQFTGGNIQPDAGSSPGAATLNMRGLGTGRSLVLVDGRRAQPVNAALAVDVNTIPSAAIARVEVISGGAAATYGPDAMAGVVNFHLKRDFEGVEVNYQTGFTEAGDGEESRADVLIGGNFDDGRGNAMFGVGWARREAAWEMSRDFYRKGRTDPGTSTNYPRISYPQWLPDPENLPSQEAVDAAFPDLPAGSQSRSTTFYVNNDGSVFRQQGAVGYTGPTDFPYKIRSQTGSVEEISPASYVSTPLTRYSAFGRGVYDLTDNMALFAQGTYVTTDVATTLFPTTLLNTPIARQPDLEPAGLRALLDSRPDPDADWSMGRVAYYIPNRSTTNQTKLYEFMVGLEGEIGNTGWSWEAYTSFGETTLLTNMVNFIWTDRYEEVVSQPGFGKGYSFETGGINSRTFTCTSGLPILEPWRLNEDGVPVYANGFELSDDCVDAITAPMTQRNVVEQRITEANFEGKIADLPAGELRSAFGLSRRENSSLFEPDALYNSVVPAEGETLVSELYGEVLVPIVSGFELELGARYSDFETGDFQQDAQTYKALFNWTPSDSLRLRGGYQRANRTPNVSELYSGATSTITTWSVGEPCRADTVLDYGNIASNPNRAGVQELCRQLIYRDGGIPGNNIFDLDPDNFPVDGGESANVYRSVREGNPRLKPEIADTWTFGIVWQSNGPDLTISADWYEIDIEDTISSLSLETAYQQCFNFDGRSNPSYSVDNEFCQLIRRNPETGAATFVEALYFNLGTRYTSGVDLEVNWRRSLAGGDFAVRSSVNRLLAWKSLEVPGSPEYEYAGTLTHEGLYDWQLFTSFSYIRDRLSLGLNWRHLPRIKHSSYVTDPDTPIEGTESYDIFNLHGQWRFTDTLRVRFGVDNVLDKEPPVVGFHPGVNNNAATTHAGRYDTLGRRFFFGVGVDF